MTSSVAELHLEKKISDEDMKLMKGQYVDDSSYDVLITDDCDVYDHVGRLLLKLDFIPLKIWRNRPVEEVRRQD